jgi:hypothetical protein
MVDSHDSLLKNYWERNLEGSMPNYAPKAQDRENHIE